jgi:hypothetical protein
VSDAPTDPFLAGTRAEFARQKAAAEKALAQLGDDDFFAQPDAESNSVAILVKHLAGNLRSRWTDFLTTDGEKPDRDRDGEFEIRPGDSRAALMAAWEDGWARLFTTLDALAPGDAGRTVRIRAERLTAAEAIQRQLAHTAGHVGQVILLARLRRGGDWRTLTVPRGESRAYTEAMLRAAEEQERAERTGQADTGNPAAAPRQP